jgi:hypothetical protein
MAMIFFGYKPNTQARKAKHTEMRAHQIQAIPHSQGNCS